MRAGQLFAVVGPSGVGKDTLMAAAKRARPDLHIVRRAITRKEALGGEEFEGLDEEDFARRRAEGAFVLDWRAHGMAYGIPVTVRDVLAAGRDALFNGSRLTIAEAAAAFPGLKVLHITAEPHALALRLAGRGRESAEEIEARLRREVALPDGLDVTEIDNSGALDEAVARLLDAVQPVRA